jgi:hypothetical protein
MESDTLIQTNCRLYLSSKLPDLALTADKKRVRGFDEVFKVLRRSFDQREQFFNLLLRQYGGSCGLRESISRPLTPIPST